MGISGRMLGARRSARGGRWGAAISPVVAVLALAVGAQAAGVAPAAADPPASAGTVAVGAAPQLPPGSRALGLQPTGTPIRLDVDLAPRDRAGITSLLAQIYDPTSPEYHRFLARGQFTARFGAPASTVRAVDAALSSLGLHPGPVGPDGLTVPVTTTAGAAAGAFGVHLARYRLPSGRVAFAETAAPRVPAAVAADVSGVVGLSDVGAPQPLGLVRRSAAGRGTAGDTGAGTAPDSSGAALHAADRVPHAAGAVPHTAGPTPCAAATAAVAPSGLTANLAAHAYGFDTGAYAHGFLGAGETVAVVEFEPFLMSDLQAYGTCYGISPAVTVRQVDGGAGTGAGAGEAALDIEQVAGLAPDATIDVYEAPDTTVGAIDDAQTIASDDTASVVSTSWGRCESLLGPGVASAEEAAFEQMALQGQTMVAAAGDTGSEDCLGATDPPDGTLTVDDPGSDPYVTGVGGTALTAVGPPPTETVWNDGYGAGGGGISTLWPMPAWQQPLGVDPYSSGAPCNAPTGSYCREVPDVSADAEPADGYAIYYSGSWVQYGGTSAAAPLWGALTALADEACGPGQTAGLLNPMLYAHPSALNDVTSGDNDLTGGNGGLYPAGPGYDMASGLGTPTAALFTPGTLCDPATSASFVASDRRGGQAATWTVGFASGSGSPLAAGTVTIQAPAQTAFPTTASDYTVDGTPATAVSATAGTGRVTVTTPVTLAAAATATVVVAGVTNPTGGAYPAGDFTVSTSAGTAAVSPIGGLTFGTGTTDVTVAASPLAAGAAATWTVHAETSATGAIARGDPITLRAPAGTVFPASVSDYLVNGMRPGAVSTAAGAVTVTSPEDVAGTTTSTIVVTGVTNPAAGAYPGSDFSVSTVADPAGTASTGITVASTVSGVGVAVSDPSGGPTGTWTITFTTSATGSLLAGTGTVTVDAPSGTGFPASASAYTVAGTAVTAAPVTAAPGVTLTTPVAVGDQDPVTVVVTGVADPAGGTYPGTAFSVSTSADTFPASPAAAVDIGTGSAPAGGGGGGGGGTAGGGGGGAPAPPAATTTTTALAASANPSAPGEAVTFTATVAPAPSGGTLSFAADGTIVGGCGAVAASIAGTATCTTTWDAAGSHAVVASFSGSSGFAASTSAALDEVVDAAVPTTTAVSVAPAAVAHGAAVTFAATVRGSGTAPTGTVTFTAGSVVLCRAALVSGTASCVSAGAPMGTDTVTGSYGGDASHAPSTGSATLVVGSTAPAASGGYWVVGADGGVYAFGDAAYAGSVPGVGVHVGDIVGMASTPDGGGYWVVGADGGVYAFGDAAFRGSIPGLPAAERPGSFVVAVAPTADGRGYWEVTMGGDVYSFGDATFHGSTGAMSLAHPVIAMAPTPDGGGYWLAAADGGLFAFGDAAYDGSVPGVGVAVTDIRGIAAAG